MRAAIDLHHSILQTSVEANGGSVFKSLGDGIAAVFETAHEAVLAAVQAQQALLNAEWKNATPLKIRIGVHSGFAEPIEGDYLGAAVNRVSRITNLGHGQQVLVSQTTLNLATDLLPSSINFRNLGPAPLDGHERAEVIHQAFAEGMPFDFPALRCETIQQTHNLVLLDRPFVGRAQERESLNKRLRDGKQRLITIRGFGGMGKTTLARVCGWDNVSDFEGVWWVDCETLDSREEIVASAFAALRKPSDPSDPERSLAETIGDSRILMIFDCFERVVLHAGVFDGLLKHCPNLQILVTSRVVLGLGWEYEFELRGLSTKKRQGSTTDGIDLFFQVASQSGQPLAFSSRAAVRAIVSMLDSIPLAIVLTSSRLRYLNLKEIREQLGRSLLGSRSVPINQGRHSNLRRVIEASFELLPVHDRKVLLQLTVFEGGFFLSDALSVLGGDDETFESICRLRDCSLLLCDRYADATRFKMLDTIREYLAEVEAPNELRDLQVRHAKHYLHLSDELKAKFDAGEWTKSAPMLTLEGGNLKVAVSTAVSLRDAWLISELGRRLLRPLLEAGMSSEFEVLVTAVLSHAGSENDLALRIEATSLQGVAAMRSGRLNEAASFWEQKAELCGELGLDESKADTLLDLAGVYLSLDNLDRVRSLVSELEKMASSLKSPTFHYEFDVTKARLMLAAGNIRAAGELMRHSLSQMSGRPPSDSYFYVLRWAAEIFRLLDEVEECEATCSTWIRLAMEGKFAHRAAMGLLELHKLFVRTNQRQRGEECLVALGSIASSTSGIRYGSYVQSELRLKYDEACRDRFQGDKPDWCKLVGELL